MNCRRGLYVLMQMSVTLNTYSPVELWWHTVTHGKGSKGETDEWSG